MPRGLRRHADDVHVVLDRRLGHLGGGLEERAEVDVEAEVGERRAHDLGATIVSVLAHLGHEHAGLAALGAGELGDRVTDGDEVGIVAVRRAVHTGDGAGLGLVPAEHPLHGVAHLADGRAGAGGVDAQRQQVAVASGARFERVEGGLTLRGVA